MEPIDEKNFGNIDFSGKLSGKNQIIYNSQLYETFFGVYADVKVNADKSIASVDLILLNYKGILDLGFHKHVQPICKYHKILDKKKNILQHLITLEFELKATISGESEYFMRVELDKSLEDIVNVKPNEDIFLKVVRELDPIWAHLDGRPPMNKGIFDNEFFFRDGTRFEEREVVNVPSYYYDTDRNRVYPNIDYFLDPGFNCKESSLRVIR